MNQFLIESSEQVFNKSFFKQEFAITYWRFIALIICNDV